MKITRITPWIITGPPEEAGRPASGAGSHLQQYVFVQVDTDEGLTGWGEITSYPGRVANRVVSGVIREVESLLVGQDPSQIEAIWQSLFRTFTYMGTRGATTAMISGIDIALWDIRGQALGLPVYELLGGAVRPNVPLYTHFALGSTVESAVEGAMGQVRGGAKAIKTDPFLWGIAERHTGYLDGSASN